LRVGQLNDKLKRIGHSLSSFCEVECWAAQRQAEAYRTFVERSDG